MTATQKNLSLIYHERTLNLAPFYDLLSTAVYGDRFSKTFAFKIGGTYQHDKIRQADIEYLENSLGIKKESSIRTSQGLQKRSKIILKTSRKILRKSLQKTLLEQEYQI